MAKSIAHFSAPDTRPSCIEVACTHICICIPALCYPLFVLARSLGLLCKLRSCLWLMAQNGIKVNKIGAKASKILKRPKHNAKTQCPSKAVEVVVFVVLSLFFFYFSPTHKTPPKLVEFSAKLSALSAAFFH